MKRIFKYLTVWLGSLLLGLACMMPQAADAASAVVTVTADAEEVRVGDVITITISIDADSVPGSFDGFLRYDSAKAEYVTGPDCAAGGEGLIRISDAGTVSDKTSRKYILYFKAAATGSADFSMRGTPEVGDSDDGYLMSVSVTGCTVNIIAASKASSDAYLSTLKISAGELSPAFDGGINDYTVQVGADTDSIYVSAETHDAAASVAVSGNTGLETGDNTVLVTVTAEDGSTMEYRIKVTKAAPAEAADNEDDTDASESGGTGDGRTETVVSSDVSGWAFYAEDSDKGLVLVADARYLVVEDSTVTIPSDYTTTTLLISGNKVTAYVKSGESDPEYVLLVLQKDGSDPGLYVYDRVEKTIQRYHTYSESGSLTREQELALVESYESSLGSFELIVVLLGIACAGLLVIAVVMTVKANSRRRRRRSSSQASERSSSGSRSSSASSAGRSSSGSSRSTASRRTSSSGRNSHFDERR